MFNPKKELNSLSDIANNIGYNASEVIEAADTLEIIIRAIECEPKASQACNSLSLLKRALNATFHDLCELQVAVEKTKPIISIRYESRR